MILAFLLSGFVWLQQPPQQQHICDMTTRATRSSDLGAPIVLWFCGPVSSSPSIQMTYQVSIDGVDIPSPGLLMRYYSGFGGHVPPPNDVSPGGRTSYISPGPIVTMTSPGPHTIKVIYGDDRRVESFTWIGVAPTAPRKEQP